MNAVRSASEALVRRDGPFRLSCVVPVLNEQDIVESFLREVAAAIAAITPHFEIIVVNDGSRDRTGAIVAGMAQELKLRVIEFSRNFGKEAAMTAGLVHARGDAVMIIDADFQEPLEAIASLVDRWRQGYDMAYAVRADRSDESMAKRCGSRMFYRLMGWSARIEIPADARDFRVMDRCVVEALKRLPERSRFMKGLFAWVGFRTIAVPVRIRVRAAGVSSFRARHLQRLALTGVTAFSVMPLRVGGMVGAVIALFAFLWGGWIVFERIFLGQPIPGFATLAAAIMLFSGVQLISIGIVGEYLGRVYEEVKGRPSYIIANDIDRSALADPAAESDAQPTTGIARRF